MLCRRNAIGVIAFLGNAAVRAAARTADECSGDPASPLRSERIMPVSIANELVVSYLAAWNEQDAGQRRKLVATTWTDGGTYVDAHRRGDGHDGIDAMIGAVQRQLPGYRVRLVSKIEAHNDYIRFSWAAGGTEQAPLYLAGTDFLVIASDGRAQSVTGFVDAAPAGI